MEAFIFDLDGVICHTDQFHYRAWKQLSDELGIYFDEQINQRLRGVSRMESLDIILENSSAEYSPEEKKKLAEKKNNFYVELLQDMSEKDLPEDVRKTLVELRQRGYLLAIGSSSKNTGLILSKLGLSDFFDAVSDGNNIVNSKPDPEVFLKAAQMLEVEPSKAIVVEDAKSGVEAAIAGGFTCAGIGDASGDERVTYKLERISDLINRYTL